MFATTLDTIDWAFTRECEAAEHEAIAIRDAQTALDQRRLTLSRRSEDRGYWKAAGCSSNAQWLAQVTSSDFSAARRTTELGETLRDLPALEAALSAGELTLDQVAAATPFATPATDAEIARTAIGKAPSQIAIAARTLSRPTIKNDQELYRRRAFRMAWRDGGRELAFSGQVPLEQGVLLEQAIRTAAKAQRALDVKTGSVLEWQQYTADALVTLATRSASTNDGDGVRRSRATVIVHLSADEPPFIERAGPVSPEHAAWLTCDARRLTIKPDGCDLIHSHITRCVSYAQMRALIKRSKHCQYPGCTSTHELQAHHMLEYPRGKTELDNLIVLCTRHHKHLHDHHIRATGAAQRPAFTGATGRSLTAHQPHAPPR